MKMSQMVSGNYESADGRTDTQNFGGYNIILSQFLCQGIRILNRSIQDKGQYMTLIFYERFFV